MNCTNKEQETAECEKRGCKGCFYNDEIKVGDYIRTKLGDIKQITEGFEFVIERLNNYITKHSSNIIDLIEVRRLCEWR